MNDLKNSCPEGLEERLLEEMETMQNELEEKEQIILQQQIQLEDSLRLCRATFYKCLRLKEKSR